MWIVAEFKRSFTLFIEVCLSEEKEKKHYEGEQSQ